MTMFRSIKKFLNKLRSPPPAESKKSIHVFGILGIVGPLSTPNSGWMTMDFAAWMFLISHFNGYTSDQSIWRTIRPINHLFPDGSVNYGDAESNQRLVLPLPAHPETDLDSTATISAKFFTTQCLISLLKMAHKVKPGEKLVLLLVGHGVLEAGEFRFLVTTQTSELDVTAEEYITKDELEFALKPCQGDILVICNSYNSRHLMSKRWVLLCSGTPDRIPTEKMFDPGYFRGSIFTACAIKQAADKHGLLVPRLPQAAHPSDGTSENQLPTLSESPPPTFPLAPVGARLSMTKPSNMSSEDFASKMADTEQFLAENSLNVFRMEGSKVIVSLSWGLPVGRQ